MAAAIALAVGGIALANHNGPLAGEWHLDFATSSGGGDEAFESSGHGYTGPEQGTFVNDGRFGKALHVVDPNDGFTIPGDNSKYGILSPSGEFTVMAWVRGPASQGDGAWIVADDTHGCNVPATFGLYTGGGGLNFSVYLDTTPFGPGEPNSTYKTVSTANVPASSIWDLQWHAVAGVYDPNRGLVGLWVDGKQVKAADLPRSFRGPAYSGNWTFYVGHDDLGVSCASHHQFKGDVDEVRVYDAALRGYQIRALQNKDATSPPELSSTAPRNTAPPELTGKPQVGQTMTCTTGTWDQPQGAAPPPSFIWERAPAGTRYEDDPSWVAIDGAGGTAAQGGNHYKLRPEDADSDVRCRVVFNSPSGTGEAVSNSEEIFAGLPLNVDRPDVMNPPFTEHELECNPGKWQNAKTFRYQWLRDGQPIDHATRKTYTPTRSRAKLGPNVGKITHPGGDGNHRIACRVVGTNALGSSAPVDSKPVLAIDGYPVTYLKPHAGLYAPGNPSDHNPLHRTGICSEGLWFDDYVRFYGGPWHYEYQWRRNDVPIPGATDRIYHPTVDDLGRRLSCTVANRNPRGKGTAFSDNKALLELPTGVNDVRIYREHNEGHPADQTNMLAISDAYREGIANVVINRLKAGIAQRTNACEARNDVPAGAPNRFAVSDQTMTDVTICRILLHDKDRVVPVFDGGVRYFRENCALVPQYATPQRPLCPSLRIEVPSIDPLRPPRQDAALLKDLEPVTPKVILWDLNHDHETDAACPGSAPVLSSIYNQQKWDPRAVIVDVDGGFHEATTSFDYSPTDENGHKLDGGNGQLRDAQVKVCSTSFDPPPDPEKLPCVTHGEIGRAQITGNLCPIAAREINQDDFNGLFDGDVRQFLINAAETDLAKQGTLTKASRTQAPGSAHTTWVSSGPPLRAATTAPPGQKQSSATLTGHIASVTAHESPIHLAETRKAFIPLGKGVDVLHVEKAQFATDQIYVGRDQSDGAGAIKINGVSLDPTIGTLTFLIPSDVHPALAAVNSMTVAARDAASRFGPPGINGIPLTDPRKIEQELPDAKDAAESFLFPGGADTQLNLDDLKNKASDLNLGPFNLAGAADVKLEKDGTATLHAHAELPQFAAKPGGEKLRVDVTLKGDLQGRLTFEGLHLGPLAAYLGAVAFDKLGLDYERTKGLDIHGQILLPPPASTGIDVKSFKIGPTGNFLGLDVDWDAGPSTSIPIGPGVYLTKLGVNLDTQTNLVGGTAAISVGPSTGGGCPAAGFDLDIKAHIVPKWYVDGNGDIVVACVSFGKLHAYADQTGVVKLDGSFDYNLGPVHANGGVGAWFEMPNWQLTLNGGGGVDHVFKGSVDAALSNRGFAACGDLEVEVPVVSQLSEWFSDDTVTIHVRAGGSVDFPKGVPPINTVALLANLHLMLASCDVGNYKPLGNKTSLRSAAAGITKFTIKKGTGPSFISLEGAGRAPHVRLRSPTGQLLDFSDAGGLKGRMIGNNWGTILEQQDRTVVLLSKPAAGVWTAQSVGGTPTVVRVRRAPVLPPAAVKGNVTGKGPRRVLHYNAFSQEGQTVRFSEVAGKTHHLLRTIKGGGKGTIKFVVAEAATKDRTIVADVFHNGLRRRSVVIARFKAGNPKVGKPSHVRVRRQGRKAIVTWGAARFAKGYVTTVAFGDGRLMPVFPKRGARRVIIPAVKKGEGLRVEIVGVSVAGTRGPAAVGRLKGSMHFGSRKHKRKPGGGRG